MAVRSRPMPIHFSPPQESPPDEYKLIIINRLHDATLFSFDI